MSNEWLTTGQMAEKLKVGEIAELEEGAQIPSKFGPSYRHVTKNTDGDIVWCKKDGSLLSPLPLVLYGHTITWKWRILLNYVSFEQAMKAVRAGKAVYLHTIQGEKVCRLKKESFLTFGNWQLEEFINGNWKIEDDTHV